MSKFKLDHPTENGTTAEYGEDGALGFFVEVRKPKQRNACYDATHPGYDHLNGALRFLMKHGFYTQDDLEDALVWLQDDCESRTTPAVRRAIDVVSHFKGSERSAHSGSSVQELIVSEDKKVIFTRMGPNKLFDRPTDATRGARTQLPREECIRRFDEEWTRGLRQGTEAANQISAEDATAELNDAFRKYFDPTQEHREFWTQGLKFIVQLDETPDGLEVTQLWHIRSADNNPFGIWVEFPSRQERAAFREAAKRIGRDEHDTSLRLLQDFIRLVLDRS